MTGGIDQVDQESVSVGLLLDKSHVNFAQLVVHLKWTFRLLKGLKVTYGDGGRLDSNATFLFVLSGVSESSFTGLGASDDTSFTVQKKLDLIREELILT